MSVSSAGALATEIAPVAPVTLCVTGTKRTLNGATLRIVIASGCPVIGKLLSPSFSSATTLSGSTSASTDRPG